MTGGTRDEQVCLSNGYDRPSNGYDRVQEEERDHINLEMPTTDEEQELQRPSPNGNARGEEEKPESRFSSLWSKYRMPIIGIFIGILIIFGILAARPWSNTTENQKSLAVQNGTLVPLNVQKDAINCPPDWFAHQGHCYKLSEEEKNWFDSQNACILHNASLAKITEEEMDIMRMFTRDRVYWIGLNREQDQLWKWLDGQNATIKIMGNGGDCAFLDNDVTAMSVRCTTKNYYMCKKNVPKTA